MSKFNKMIPYLIIYSISVYVLPLFGSSTGSYILILLFLLPTVSFVLSYLYAMNNKRNFLFSLFVGLIFIPSVYVYYNSSAYFYVGFYAVVSGVGNIIGSIVTAKKSKQKTAG